MKSIKKSNPFAKYGVSTQGTRDFIKRVGKVKHGRPGNPFPKLEKAVGRV